MSAFLDPRIAANAARAALAVSIAGAAALIAGGCANTGAARSTSVEPAAYVAQGPAMAMESDGLPVQAAPSATIRQLPDDPAQPFSPNYGGDNPARNIAAPPVVKASSVEPPVGNSIPDDLPPLFRKQLAAATAAAG
jgi:hypothetical protein